MHETRKGGSEMAGLFGSLLQIPTEVMSPNIADTTFNGSSERNHSLPSGADQAGPAGAAGVPVALL